MKVLHVSYADERGGAARAAYRIHRSLAAAGVDSRMLVRRKFTSDPAVEGPQGYGEFVTKVRSRIGSYLQRTQISSNEAPHSSNLIPTRWSRAINGIDADVVNLHWVGASAVSARDIGAIKRPVVFTLHDMWAFSGSEHYSSDTAEARWRTGYTRENRPPDHHGFDLDRWSWQRKRRSWRRMVAIAPSRWLADCAKNSALMTDWPVEVIPNPVDASVFQPHRRAEARRSVGLPASASIILSGAMGGANDPRKGFDLLAKALGNLKTVDSDYLPVIFGQEEPSDPDKLGLPTKWMGRIEEDRELALLYSAADAMVVPSRMEAFGQTASEALACGTPVIAFDATGLKDIVTHRRTGYLASPYSTTDLAHGIKWVVDIERRSQALGQAARERAERLWDSGTVADQYIAAYRSMLSR